MCRLLAVVANKPVRLTFSLIDASNSLFNQASTNPDGWGIAAYQNNDWSLVKEAKSAQSSKEFEETSQKITGEIIISHIRKASVGTIDENNTHPFKFNNWVLAHNGTIHNSDKLKLSLDIQPTGQTDSERIFCLILSKIQQLHGSLNSVPPKVVAEAMEIAIKEALEIDFDAKINLLLSDGHALYIYRCNKPLYWVSRVNIDLSGLESDLLRLYKDKASRGEKALLIASEQLTGTKEQWLEVPEKQVLVVDAGALEKGLQPANKVILTFKQIPLIDNFLPSDIEEGDKEETIIKSSYSAKYSMWKDNGDLFIEPSGQLRLIDKSIEQETLEDTKVECLGITFDNDEARRAYFLEKLREKLKDPEFRKIEGFPIGEDEVILRLSDPPYYTACPNPFIEEFIKHYGKQYNPDEPYNKEPFAADVSEGKNDPIYNAHSYHTKVPHKAIMRYILHYTEPGDIVFDGFCGTGMTGIAANLCGNKSRVLDLGYKVLEDNTIFDEDNKLVSKLGARYALLNDLSPSAIFIAKNYNTYTYIPEFKYENKNILEKVEQECGWMYLTLHKASSEQKNRAISTLNSNITNLKTQNIPWGIINYTVWSDVFICPECSKEIIFWEVAVNKKDKQIKKEFFCNHCKFLLDKRKLRHAWVNNFDKALNKIIKQRKQVPVLIKYFFGNKQFEKTLDDFDLELFNQIEKFNIPHWFPTDRMVDGDESRRNDSIGITHLHHFYTKRSLYVLSALRAKCKPRSLLVFQSIVATLCSHLTRYNLGNRGNGNLSGTLYISSLNAEANVLKAFYEKTQDFSKAFCINNNNFITNQSSTKLGVADNSVDYIFIDPPFGGNFMYSELNFIWESWLRIFTDNKLEAIENDTQKKTLDSYRYLMTQCFKEAFRILKPGRWATVEFSNTQASVWNAIQTALQEVGFVVANVSALDKKQGSFKAVTTTTAVKQDLVISAYKPNGGLEERFLRKAYTEDSVWDFVRTHLKYLPRVKIKNGEVEFIVERDPRILFDRMVAYFVQHGYPVPISTQEFQLGLSQRFPERDGMIFLPEQVLDYDKKRIQTKNMIQRTLFVEDERSAIDWLYEFLKKRPSTRQTIHPEFIALLGIGWKKFENRPELVTLLEENFLEYNGIGDIPDQIYRYLSSNFKDLRNLHKNDPVLIDKAKNRWYVPDPNKATDLEKIREKSLLKEFEEYRLLIQKQLKTFRLEAVRAGFKKAWQEKNYQLIIDVARKIPENILFEDDKLLFLYEMAKTRIGDE